MSKKLYDHLISVNYEKLSDKIKEAQKKSPTRRNTKKFNKRTA